MADEAVPKSKKSSKRGLVTLIGIFKLLKGCLMLIGAAVAMGLLSQSVEDRIRLNAHNLGVAPYRQKLGAWISDHVLRLSHKELVGVAMIALLYAGLFFTEGVGLLLDKLWAEWLTVITTGLLLIPEGFEVYEKVSLVRIAILIANIATVVYLIYRVRRRGREAGA